MVHLSSGEKQRLALLRGLSRRPKVLLLDEPTANLDVDNAAAVEQLLQTMQEREGLCMLWTTHHDLQRDRVAKRTLSIESGDWVEEYRA